MSGKVATPIIREIKDNRDELKTLEDELLSTADAKTQDIIMNYPTVYIHNWKNTDDFEVYVGESNNVFRRTREHYDESTNKTAWQYKLLEKDASLFIIGHEHFNKSLTLDIENRLMHYMMSIDRVKVVHNDRGNPQSKYYTSDEFEEIFRKVWRGLRKRNKDLFPTESAIKDSAIYKASPTLVLLSEGVKEKDCWLNNKRDLFTTSTFLYYRDLLGILSERNNRINEKTFEKGLEIVPEIIKNPLKLFLIFPFLWYNILLVCKRLFNK